MAYKKPEFVSDAGFTRFFRQIATQNRCMRVLVSRRVTGKIVCLVAERVRWRRPSQAVECTIHASQVRFLQFSAFVAFCRLEREFRVQEKVA